MSFCISALNRYAFSFCILLLLIFGLVLYIDSKYVIEVIKNTTGKITKINQKSYEITNNHGTYFVIGETSFSLGSIVHVEGKATDLNDSSFINYLKSRHVIGVIKQTNHKFISSTFSLKNHIYNYVNSKSNLYSDYTNIFILGKITNLDLREKFLQLNIVHLFVISGFHIYYINKILCKLLKFKNKDYISLLIIFAYLWLIDFQIPASKTFLILLLTKINENFWKQKLSKTVIFLVVVNLFLLYEVNSVYSLSFILTFLFSFFINLINSVKIKEKRWKIVFFWLWINVVSITLNLYLNNSISLFMIIYNLIYTIIISLVYPVLFLTWWIVPFAEGIYIFFNNSINVFNNFNLILKINQINIWLIYILFSFYSVNLLVLIYWTNKPKYFAYLYI